VPNGGSDCCGTCWFNAKNKGDAGYDHADDPEPPFCTIRALAIDNPFYMYCSNHPHRRPDRDPIPIGPVFTGNESGERDIWQASPDTEVVRQHLLRLLGQIEEHPTSEYPLGIYIDEIVVWQAGEFGDKRSIEHLQRIVSFDPTATMENAFGRTREDLVLFAEEALEKIEHGPA